MESDSIRPSGTSTLVDIWVEGKVRAVSVTRAAIETFAGFERATRMSDNDRCEFVRAHLGELVSAVKTQLRDTDPTAYSITIDANQLGTPPGGKVIDRRRGERRRTDRRKKDLPKDQLPHGERRRAQRRKRDRRGTPGEA